MKKTLVKQFAALVSAIALGTGVGVSATAQTPQPLPDSPQTAPETITPEATPGTAPGTTTPEAIPGTAPGTTTPGVTPETPGAEAPQEATGNIVELASSNGSFQTLVQAVESAGLAELLAGEGPYTVFAPTDEAFAELPEGLLERLLLPENREILQQILAYHVVQGEIPSSEITPGTIDTLFGGIAVDVDGDRAIVNDASVIQADIQATNGIIHAINRVLLPPQVQELLTSQLEAELQQN
ncbi:MAG: fasciclin domain-containing protein [Desertifilum sp.]|nr:fasciclin domain-containing protein [Desertifilum sp.]